nr:recombinase family protein [uncultured Caproiciproducens sp.]
MKIAVAYARYSSDNQRQESIDAQARAIKDYCKKNDIMLMHIYIDEAVSATTDQRDQFLQMVEDAKKGSFQLCIVHKLDRFARNRYDSAFYRRELEKCG